MSNGRHALPRTSARRTPGRVSPPRRRNPRAAVVSALALSFAFGMAVTSATTANASPLGAGEAAAVTAATIRTASVAGQSFRVGDVDEQTVSWDSFSATSAAAVQAQVTSSEVAAAVDAATAQLATSSSRSETASEIASTTTLKRGDGAAMVAYALQYVGKVPYVLGGTSPSVGFSCDTFVEYVYAAFGDVMTGDVDAIATHATVISKSEAKAGDLVYYPHQHIGIYDGAGGIIDAPKPGRDVSHRAVWGSPEYLRITN